MKGVILSLCDLSGVWSDPYRQAGYDVRQFDLKTGSDVRSMDRLDLRVVDGILAAPPCTDLAGSGARWWKGKGDGALLDALSIADACLRAVVLYRPRWWALENPTGRLSRFYGPPAYSFDPCDYGDPYTKRTHLWGQFTPPTPLFSGGDRSVEPTEGSKMHRVAPGPERQAIRSRTPEGFARAFFEANP